jgi:hypothetical protein
MRAETAEDHPVCELLHLLASLVENDLHVHTGKLVEVVVAAVVYSDRRNKAV